MNTMTKKPLHPLKAIALCLLIMPWHGCFGAQETIPEGKIKILYSSDIQKETNQKSTYIDYKANKTIQQIKQEITKATNIPIEQQNLTYREQGNELNDGTTLQANNINHKMTIHLAHKKIFIKALDDNFSINFDPNDTIKEVRQKIKDQKGIPTEVPAHILYQGKMLFPKQKLNELNVQAKRTVDLVMYLHPLNITIAYKDMPGSDPFTIKIDKFSTLQEIKEKIHKEKGHPIETQILWNNGKKLEDEGSYSNRKNKDKSTLELLLLEPTKDLSKQENNNDTNSKDIDINNDNNILNTNGNDVDDIKDNKNNNNNNEINNNNDNNNTTTYVIITLGILGILGIGYVVHNKSTQKPTKVRDTSKQAT